MTYTKEQHEIEEAILDLIDHADEMTRSDLQGAVMALSMKLSTRKLTNADIETLALGISKTVTTDQLEGGEQLDEDEVYTLVEEWLIRHNASH